jgi:DNA polymerase elongation subunit (family B)
MNLEELSDAELLQLYETTKSKKVEYNGKQLATKIFANAFYGGLANSYSRWFSYDIAESITLTGQLASKYVEKYANEYLNKLMGTAGHDYVIAVDTDSAYFDMEKVIQKAFPNGASDKEAAEFLVKFSEHIEEKIITAAMEDLYKCTNAYQKKFHMKLEIIGQAIWRKAKNYVMGIMYEEGTFYNEMKIKMKGIEAVKSSTPEVCRNYIKDSIPLILKGDAPALRTHIDKCREEFDQLPFDRVANPGGVNGLLKYGCPKNLYTKGTPFRVRGSLLYNKLVADYKLENELPLIQDGDKIRFLYLKLPNPIKENVVAAPDEMPEEFGLDEYIDYDLQFERTVLKPVSSLSIPAGISLEDKSDLSQFY